MCLIQPLACIVQLQHLRGNGQGTAAGCLSVMPAMPIGQVSSLRRAVSSPRASIRCSKLERVCCAEPIRPKYAASRRAKMASHRGKIQRVAGSSPDKTARWRLGHTSLAGSSFTRASTPVRSSPAKASSRGRSSAPARRQQAQLRHQRLRHMAGAKQPLPETARAPAAAASASLARRRPARCWPRWARPNGQREAVRPAFSSRHSAGLALSWRHAPASRPARWGNHQTAATPRRRSTGPAARPDCKAADAGRRVASAGAEQLARLGDGLPFQMRPPMVSA